MSIKNEADKLQRALISKIKILSDAFERGDGDAFGVRTGAIFASEIARYIAEHRAAMEALDASNPA